MKFSRSDAAITATIFALSSILFLFFLRDVNALSSGSDADALGVIEFRKNSATRKASDSMRWERLRDKSVVYRGDTIRTADLSEAGIQFEDGTKLDIFENSMLRLDFLGDEQTFELSGGAMRLAGGDASGATRVIKIGDSLVSVPAEADVSMLSGGGRMSLDVSGGAVSVTSASGVVTTVGESEELSLDSKTGTLSVVKKKIIPVSPAQGETFVFLPDENPRMTFFARADVVVASTLLELSAESSFAAPAQTIALDPSTDGTYSGELSVAPGVWYWRARAEDGAVSSVRRLSVATSAPPAPVWPEDGAIIGFRKETPKIRFSWSESPEAVAYSIELWRGANSATPERAVRTKLTALTLSSLAAGEWSWRVIPEYPRGYIVNPVPSAIRRFSIVPSDKMLPVMLLSPPDGSLADVRHALSFSWESHAEASLYELRFYSSLDGKNRIASFPSDKSWLSLDATQAQFLGQKGTKYWSVVWKDAEGNESPLAAIRKIESVDGSDAVTLTFPPDGYTIADSLSANVRFSWKGVIGANASFQLSRESSFSSIALAHEISGNSIPGFSLDRGLWYWRIRVLNPDGTVFTDTDARSFTVVAPFLPPVLKNPKPGSSVTVLEGKSVNFSWDSIDDTARYSCKLYRTDEASSDGDKPAFVADNIETLSCSVPLGSMPDGSYRVVLQAYAPDGAMNTAIGGYLGEATLFVGKIVSIEFMAPKKNTVFDGVSAKRTGVTIRWKSAYAPESLSVSLTRNGSLYPLDFSWKSGISSLHLASLPEGKYSVTIKARTGSFDVSPSSPLTFTVSEIARLSAPVLTAPADKTVFDQKYLSAKRAIAFEWKLVKGATHYAFRILSDSTGKEVFRREKLTEPAYELDDLTCLDKGKFTWEVVAGNYSSDGIVDQIGKASSGKFTVFLPDLVLPGGAKETEYYGL